MPSFSNEELNKDFEFVLIKRFGINKCDKKMFHEKFNNCDKQKIIVFESLGRDAILVVPCPIKNKNFSNLKTFTKNADEEHQILLWKQINKEMINLLNHKKKFWLSTHGDAINYLHVRLDFYPKYFVYKKYKNNF